MKITGKGVKHDAGKLPYDLLPWQALEEVVKVLEFGAAEYGPYNWASGMKFSRLLAAAFRHLVSYWRGERNDAETGYSHLAHAVCCLLFLLHFNVNYSKYCNFDDVILIDKSTKTEEK